MESNNKRAFLTQGMFESFEQLSADQEPSFGIMSAQHMVEHLSRLIKSTSKNHGEPPAEPTKGQIGFRKFIDGGTVFRHFPKDKTKADLDPVKYGSLEEAIEQLSEATRRFYHFFDNREETSIFHPFMGTIQFEELENLHYQHCRYHLWQFEQIEQYP